MPTQLGDFTAGQILTADDMNDIATWTTFTPSFTGITLGTGSSNTGQYCQLNEILFIRTRTVLGTGGSFTNPVLTVPASKVATGSPTMLITNSINAVLIDLLVNTYPLAVRLDSTTTLSFYAQTASGTYLTSNTAVSATVPFTSAVNDVLEIAGWIQVN
jgi:hypothetical protein